MKREALLTVAVAVLAVVLLLPVLAVNPATFARDDMLAQYLGASREVWQAAKLGHLALMTTHSWFGGALAGEYQHGVFSVFAVATQVFAWSLGVPLRFTALALVAVPIALLMAGTFRLARVEGCSVAASVFAAILVTFNGWMLRWAIAWYPTLSTFAWVPWLLWALRRGGPMRPFLVIVFTYAIVAGGWPLTLPIALLASGVVLLDELVRTRTLRSLAPIGLGALLGCCLAAPALFMLFSYGTVCKRLTQSDFVGQWRIPLHSLPGLIAPGWISMWKGGDWRDRPAIELWLGLPLAFIGALLLRARAARPAVRRAAPWLALALTAFVLGMLPIPRPLRFPFRWLPLVHLAIGIAAAIGLDAWLDARETGRSARLWLPGALIMLGGGIDAILGIAQHSVATGFLATSATALLIGAAMLRATPDRAPAISRALPAAAAVLGVLVLLRSSPMREIATWPAEDALLKAAPFDPARTYLGAYGQPQMNEGVDLRFGNTPLLADLTFVNGYSPLGPKVVRSVSPFDAHGWVDGVDATVLRIYGDDDFLDGLGIDGLVLSPHSESMLRSRLLERKWELSATIPSGSILASLGPPRAARLAR